MDTMTLIQFPLDKFINAYQFDNPAANAELIRCIREDGGKLSKQTVVKAYMTDWRLQMDHKSALLDPFFKFINDSISNSMANLAGVTKDPFQYRMANMWGAIYEPGDYTEAHSHAPCQISFVYYVQADDSETAPLIFPEIEHTVIPSTGLLVMCPGWLTHYVPKYQPKTNSQRIVIAGNIEIQ